MFFANDLWLSNGRVLQIHCKINCNSRFSLNKKNAYQIIKTKKKNQCDLYHTAHKQAKFEVPKKRKCLFITYLDKYVNLYWNLYFLYDK